MNIENYFENLKKNIDVIYSKAGEAKGKGFDPVDSVEISLAMSMAEKVVNLVSTIYPQVKNELIINRILDLEKEYGKLDTTVVFKIAQEVAEEKYCKFNSLLEAMDAGIRVGFAYATLGVVSSPIEGFTGIKFKKTKEGKDYIEASFSGPIRSAGTTASCVVLILIDFLREHFGFSKYDPTEEEIKRTIVELTDFHERISNLQYFPTEEEVIFLMKNIPIQISGEPSESVEVSNFKNLERVDTNYLRSGFCLIFAEGLAQKAAKGLRLFNIVKKNGVNSSGFDFLEDYVKIQKKKNIVKEADKVPVYIKDIVGGRPIFGYPSESGAFRFRYGRGRSSGFSAVSLHPATMAICDNFIATGTQLKLEKPSKGCVATSCDCIEGPIVKLKNGSVRKLLTKEDAEKNYNNVEEIIYLGDILFPFSDVLNRNSDLIKSGYVEEWWKLELKEKGCEIKNCFNVNFDDAVKYSKECGISLYPRYIYYWTQISKNQLEKIIEYLRSSDFGVRNSEVENIFGLLGVPFEIINEKILIKDDDLKYLKINLGNLENFDFSGENVLEIINKNSEFEIRDKAGSFIGARMGRPEKAKLRKSSGNPNVLFPIGSSGGRLKSIQVACEKEKVLGIYPLYFCKKCNSETIYPYCENCGGVCCKKYYFYDTKERLFENKSNISSKQGVSYNKRELDVNYFFNDAVKKLGLEGSDSLSLVKGVEKMSGSCVEHLSKGILRSKYNLQVNKDGTIRFDATELPLVSFKPKEIGVGFEKLRELGYDKDIDGNELVNNNQILELMPHDILLPCCENSPDEKADDVFIKICNFIDELLVKLYGMKPLYNVKNRDDLIGKLGVCMAPHNCAGVVCRFIGFSNTQGLFASPYMHAAIRRDCFDYNTYIPIKRNGLWKNVKIGEYVDKLNPQKIIDNFNTREIVVKNVETIGYDKGVREVNVNNFTKHDFKEMFKVSTSLGKEIIITENHKFLIDGKIKSMNNLRIGDKLPLPYNVNIESKDIKEINLLDYIKDEDLMVRNINFILKDISKEKINEILVKINITKRNFLNFRNRDSYPIDFVLNLDKKTRKEVFEKGYLSIKRDNVLVPIKIKLGDDLLKVIGLYIAEGFCREKNSKKGFNQIDFASKDSFLRNFVREVFGKYFNIKSCYENDFRVTFSSRLVYLFFTKILECGSYAYLKRIPSLFLGLPLERLACILSGYYEGDGSVSLGDRRVTCDSVSEGLLSDLEFCLGRFGIFVKRYRYKKKPGEKVRSFYIKKKREIPEFEITKLIIGSDFVEKFSKIGFLSDRKNSILEKHLKKKGMGMRINYDSDFVYDPVVSIESIGMKESYCLNVNTNNHLVMANSIVSRQCDGDEASIMLLGDVLLNFSRKFLSTHRGSTQDAPLVLNARIDAGEVDDQILDFEFVNSYPLDLYRLAEQGRHSSEVKINTVKDVLRKGENPFFGAGFTHDTSDINLGVSCSSYKTLATMKEKVEHQMKLIEKIRAVNEDDVAKLIIERHFIRDIRGNFRKFSMQNFRCVSCGEIVCRVPLKGVCPKCGGKLIFTINEGGIKKYLQPALDLSEEYEVGDYLRQCLGLLKKQIDSVFG